MRLTKPLLLAIEEALHARLAGEIDIADEPNSPKPEHYRRALVWAEEQIERRTESERGQETKPALSP